MVQQTIRKDSSWNPPAREKTSLPVPRPIAVQAQQNPHELFVQRATRNEDSKQSLERAARFGHNFANVPNLLPATQTSAPVQAKPMTDDHSSSPMEQRPNQTGLPDRLKAGIEHLSGYSLDNVKVHYNSDKPTQLNALAYTQGTEIHVAPEQEQHLPHEAWHVVQQAQGRVKPTMQMKDGVPVNDDKGLEHEADTMGAKALRGQFSKHPASGLASEALPRVRAPQWFTVQAVVQREVTKNTMNQWEANAANVTKDRTRKAAFADVTQLIHKVLWNPGKEYHVSKLHDALQALKADAHYTKYYGAIDGVLADLAGDQPLSKDALRDWVNDHAAMLFPENAGDFAAPQLLALRKKILINKMFDEQYTASRMVESAASLAQRGILGGEWVGRGLCQEASQAFGNASPEISPKANGSTITWNHYFNNTGATWIDTTWKQFFHGRCDTAGHPAIFTGNRAAFIALGLPHDLTDDYLHFIGK